MEKLDEKKSSQTFKDRLIDELKYHDIPYKVFASKVGISISTLNMYLYRNSIPLADVAVKTAKVLNTSVEFLITGEKGENAKESSFQRHEIMQMVNTFSDDELACFLKITCAFKDALDVKTII